MRYNIIVPREKQTANHNGEQIKNFFDKSKKTLDKFPLVWYNVDVLERNKKNKAATADSGRKRYAMANTNKNGMKKSEVLRALKDEGMGLFQSILDDHDAIKTGDYTYVVESATLPGKYFQVAITAKDVITDDDGKRIPYDPFIEVDRYEMEQEEKRLKAEERKRKHDETVKRAAERRAKAKANAEAKKAAKAKVAETPAE